MKYLPVIMLGFLAACLHVTAYYTGLSTEVGTLVDPDGYMRLLRIEQLLETGNWYDQSISLANAPYGHPLPWSRLIDILIILIALLMGTVTSSSHALFNAGVWFSPLMLMLASCAIPLILVRKKVSGDVILVLSILFFTQPGMMTYFAAARPDHHSLLLALTTIHLAFIYCNSSCANRNRYFIGHGIIQGLLFWSSVESITVWFCASAVYAALWLNNAVSAKANACYHLSVFFTSLAAVAIETPWALLDENTFDRLSRNYLVLLGLVPVAWLALWRLSNTHPERLTSIPSRLVAGILSMMTCLFFTHLFAASLWGGPMSAISPELQTIWLDRITEFQPIAQSYQNFIQEISIWIPCLVIGGAYVVYRSVQLISQKKYPTHFEMAWIIHAIVFTGLIFYQKRWSAYACLVWIVPATAAAIALFTLTLQKTGRRSLGLLAMTLVALSPILLSLNAITAKASSKETIATSEGPNHTPHENYLDWIQTLPDNAIILAPMDLSPEIMYFTKRRTVGGHYHTNPDGIFDSYYILSSKSFEHAKHLLLKRGIQYILVDTSLTSATFYASSNQEPTLYQKLKSGTPPEYCTLEKKWSCLIAYKVVP